jgi:hypothetical protein
MWRRISTKIAECEIEKEKWQRNFEWLLTDFKFIHGGRIMFSTGRNKYKTGI